MTDRIDNKGVATLMAYMASAWPSYQNWERYTKRETVEVWVDMLRREGVTKDEAIQGVQDIVRHAPSQWPPSLAQVVDAASQYGNRRRELEREAAREAEYREADLALIDRLRDSLNDPDGKPDSILRLQAAALERLEAQHPDA